MQIYCRGCLEEKPEAAFRIVKSAGRAPHRRKVCKVCEYVARKAWAAKNKDKIAAYNKKQRDRRGLYNKDYHNRYKYGISLEERNLQQERQGGNCGICGAPGNGKLNLDHCHATGTARGLLCTACNTVLGLVREDTGILNKAIDYLTTRGIWKK